MQQHNITYELLGNDNGFLPYADNSLSTFQQRTLVARWMLNASVVPGATHDRAELVRKPVLNVMALLARIGDRIYDGPGSAPLPASIATVNILGTSRGFGLGLNATTNVLPELAALVYNSDDSALGPPQNVSLAFNVSAEAAATLGEDAAIALYRLDNSHGNAFAAWQTQGLPKIPTDTQFQQMREAAEVVVEDGFPQPVNLSASLVFEVCLDQNDWTFSVVLVTVSNLFFLHPYVARQIPSPGLALAHICAKPSTPPAMVANVRLHVPPRASANATAQQLLVLWDADDQNTHRCVRTFAVSCNGTRVNSVDTIFTSFAHTQNYTTAMQACCYSVAAVDYWGRSGPATSPVCPP